jgi:hypothetical protein
MEWQPRPPQDLSVINATATQTGKSKELCLDSCSFYWWAY